MRITNHANLPQPLVDAITFDPYTGGKGANISVTRLIQPARKVALEKLHASELTEDASDRVWALFGQLGHLVLERSNNGQIVEKRFFMKLNGWTLSGQCDLLDSNTILDYKFTSVWAAKDGVKKEWEQQLNLLAMLARHDGSPIDKIQIVAIFRDWSLLEAKRDASYPQRQVAVLDVPLWAEADALLFAGQRIEAHQIAQNGSLPQCTEEERWAKPPVFAVMKKGQKRAVKLHDMPSDAEQHAANCGGPCGGFYVEHRPGQQVRCANYCAARPWCEQAKALLQTEQPHEQPLPF